MYAIVAVFIYFFIPVLSRSYFTSRTPHKDQKIEQLFYFLFKSYNPEISMNPAVNGFAHAAHERSQKWSRVKNR